MFEQSLYMLHVGFVYVTRVPVKSVYVNIMSLYVSKCDIYKSLFHN